MNIFLYSKSNKTKYKTYKIIFNYKNKDKIKIKKLGIYNPKLNLFSCIYYMLISYLKQGLTLSKKLVKLLIYFIKYL